MRRCGVLVLVVWVSFLLAGQLYAFKVYRLGGAAGNPWRAALSLAPGEYWVVGPDGSLVVGGSFSPSASYPTWQDTLIEVVDSLGGEWLRPFFVPDTLNLAQDGVRDRISRGISSNLHTSDACYNQGSTVQRMRPIFDGDPTTAAFYPAAISDNPEALQLLYVQNSIIDLGVDYPVNRVRFFPRLGTRHPRIDQILASMRPPRLRKEELLEEDFSGNFLPWFEVSGAHSALNFAANCYWQTRDNPFFRRIHHVAAYATNDPRLTILRTETENLEVVVDFQFPTQQLQWVAIRPINPDRNWEIAEFQVFGLGYIQRTVYTTAVLDFERPMALGKIRWSGHKEKEARVLIRTRTGSTPDPYRYWLPSIIPGELREIGREEYERSDVVARIRTRDEENWSFWSSPYPWEAGLRDERRLAGSWEDGTAILSPSPNRYLQLQVVFLSSLYEADRLRELEFQFSSPAASRVVGEIWPVEVGRAESARFVYNVLPTFSADDQGFDRLEIFTLTRAEAVHSVRVDGVEMSDRFPPEILADRLVLGFPKLQGATDTFKLIEVEFEARVVRYGTEFQGWVFDSQGEGVKQLIEPGDATVEFPGNTLGVRTGELGAGLIVDVAVSPNPFTPNEDGVNDQVRFQFELHEVSAWRTLTLEVYDLSGRLVRRIGRQHVIRGLFAEGWSWDGVDEQGRKVAPGIYLYRLSLETDQGTEEHVGTVAVAY